MKSQFWEKLIYEKDYKMIECDFSLYRFVLQKDSERRLGVLTAYSYNITVDIKD